MTADEWASLVPHSTMRISILTFSQCTSCVHALYYCSVSPWYRWPNP
uniref:Uncharacterized protein n=1 Tax=Rhizophora mucronata TaxID=61149 RepID=A0A2P2N5T9_RHIMU